MNHLQACYFCGVAEADPLREVTVTPRSRRDDPQAQVSLTLCRSCEKKLERVLDGLFEHVESEVSADTADSEPGESGESPTGESVDQIDVGTEAADTSVEPEGTLEADAEAPARTEPAQAGESAASPDEDVGAEDEPRVTARATMNPADSLEGLSVEEYNRVMRLLQNREFPMEREAFVTLATNAYELHADEVQALLEEVIENGKLAVRDDQLVRPDDEASP
ncbi:MAG: hypothetical protein ABEH59_11080 [Halobacteriales archaeon]